VSSEVVIGVYARTPLRSHMLALRSGSPLAQVPQYRWVGRIRWQRITMVSPTATDTPHIRNHNRVFSRPPLHHRMLQSWYVLKNNTNSSPNYVKLPCKALISRTKANYQRLVPAILQASTGVKIQDSASLESRTRKTSSTSSISRYIPVLTIDSDRRYDTISSWNEPFATR
jgi:hypothetical protein